MRAGYKSEAVCVCAWCASVPPSAPLLLLGEVLLESAESTHDGWIRVGRSDDGSFIV